jgi:hypothetical protein
MAQMGTTSTIDAITVFSLQRYTERAQLKSRSASCSSKDNAKRTLRKPRVNHLGIRCWGTWRRWMRDLPEPAEAHNFNTRFARIANETDESVAARLR